MLVQNEKTWRWVKVVLAAVPMVVMMVVIFLMSHQAGVESTGMSEGVEEFIVEILDIEVPPDLTPSTVPIIFGLNVRKLAHIFLYAYDNFYEAFVFHLLP